MSDSLIKTATSSDANQCFSLLTLAFSSDPACRWSWPDPQQYLEAFPRFARAFGGAAIGLGTAHYYEGFTGVALWLPPGTAPDEEALVKVMDDTVNDDLKDSMFSMFEQFNSYHPAEPHWHLPLIGVDPAKYSRGIGSALLHHVLDQCDREKVLAYLEATSPRNVPLYQRHGFEPQGKIQVVDSPEIVPMVRKPR